AAALDRDPLDPAPGIEARARRTRGRQVGELHRLLRVARAAEGALAAAAAAGDVAVDGLAAEPEGAHTPVEDLGVPPDDLPRHGADADHALHLVEVGRHGRRVGVGDPVLAGPRAEHACRRAEAGAGVDHRRPAHALPERQRDRRAAEGHGRAAVSVEALYSLHGRAREVGLREVAALLEDDDTEPGARELVRRHGAARARAHHTRARDLRDVAAHPRVL